MHRQHVVFLGRPGVSYEERPPPAALAPWVAVYWRIETDVDFDLRIPPDGCMDLIGDDVVGSFSRFDTARLPAGSVSQGIPFLPTPRMYAWSPASPDTASVSFVAGSGPPPARARSG